MLAPEERWLPVVGFAGQYEVSDLGHVRSLDRIAVYRRRDQYSGRDLAIRRVHKGKLLRPAPMKSGHLTVVLGRRNTRQVHALVLEAFRGTCPEGQECLHGDGIPSHNWLSNLRWGTRSENLLDAVRHGTKPIGDKHYGSKLRSVDIPKIRSLFGQMPFEEIGRRYGVSGSTIRQIRNGCSWKHVPLEILTCG